MIKKWDLIQLKIFNFLDVTFDLNNNSYCYMLIYNIITTQ